MAEETNIETLQTDINTLATKVQDVIQNLDVVTENVAEYLTNSVNMTSKFYDIFLNPEAMTVKLEMYNDENELVEVLIPNRAKDRVDTAASNTVISVAGKIGEVTLSVGDVSGAQPTLVSGSNIKTINSASILEAGNINLQVPLVSGTNIKTINNESILEAGNINLQVPLVSGTNIKTINNESILSAGNLNVANTDLSNLTSTGENKVDTVKDQRDNSRLKYWTGTKEQYDAIELKDENTIYSIINDADLTMDVLELLYPVGSIYIGTMNVCPLATIGVGSWALKSSGRVLQGSDNDHAAGSTIEAGLPNITGSFNTDNGDWVLGAFYTYGETNSNGAASPDYIQIKTYFDASRSSNIYGNSTTVQPPAYVVNIWERIA